MQTDQPTSRQYRYRIEHVGSRVTTFTAWRISRQASNRDLVDARIVTVITDLRITPETRYPAGPKGVGPDLFSF